MKKEWTLPVLAWLAAAGGFALRAWELAESYDPVSRRMAYPCSATGLLWALAAVLTAALFFLCRGMGTRTPEDWFYDPSTGNTVLTTCAGFVLMAAGGLGLYERTVAYRTDTLALLTCLCCLVGGAATVAYAAFVHRGQHTAALPLPLMAICIAFVVWLVATYQQHARQPVTELFVWQILSGVCIVLAVYHLVTLSMGRGNALRTAALSLLCVPLTGIALADGLPLPFALISLSAMLLLTAQSRMLLRAAFGPPRPERMPAGSEQTDSDPTCTQE